MKHPIIARTLKTLALAALAAGYASAAQAWTKSYVVEWYEPAMYFGATTTGVTDVGTDCPKGVNPEPDWLKVMVKAGYTIEEAKWLRDPTNPTRSPVNGQNQMAFRGKDRANVYSNPTSVADPGLVEMTGAIAEGINLDGDKKTGFVSPTGEKGIDNAFYKAMGCWKTYRGPPRLSSGAQTFNDAMREGSWTVLIVLSGAGKDPLNDNKVDVGFYMSGDKIVKDGLGNVSRDYSFRIKPDYKFEALFKAKTSKGVLTTKEPTEEIWLRDPGYARELQVLKARLSMTMEPDGSLKGYLGGYRPWESVYKGWVNARGPVIEALTWVELPAVYYALKRNADYSPTGPKGEKTHISFAMRIDALPAYVTAPDGLAQTASIDSYKAKASPPPQLLASAAFRIVDGLVMEQGGKTTWAGPHAVILPPAPAKP